MTESDKLLAKADALLARGRSTVVVPQPPADYPMLTEVVRAPVAKGKVPQQKAPANVPEPLSTPTSAITKEAVAPGSPPPAQTAPPKVQEPKDASPATIKPGGASPTSSPLEPAPRPDDATMQSLEERVYLRVLNAIEPFVGTFIEDPLRLRLEELARELAAGIAADARNEIMTLVRKAVRSAVARELEARRNQ